MIYQTTFMVVAALLASSKCFRNESVEEALKSLMTKGEKNLLHIGGSKARYLGGGWWKFSGYCADDLPAIESKIKKLEKYRCKTCGVPISSLHVYCTKHCIPF